ncbi:heavy-metal-associated domain-containing protein [Maribacter algarum]|nr:heavy metal-associated domain-containing protein [Maribacter algarum]
MRIKTSWLLLFMAFSSAILAAQHREESIKISVTIEGMACQEGCADTIAENLRKVEGINTAEVSYKNGEALIEYDNRLISIDGLKKIITDTKVKNYVYIVKEVRAITNEIEE